MPEIRVSAVAFLDAHNRILSVRKRGTTMFMQPGGKPEPGETPAQTAIREVHEELGLTLDAAQLIPLGQHSAAAANESGYTVVADVFTHPLVGTPAPAAEIEEIRWDALDGPLDQTCAALMREKIVPLLRERVMGVQIRPSAAGH